MGKLLGDQLKEVCPSILTTGGSNNQSKEDEVAKMRRESEEFRKSVEERMERLTLENEQLRRMNENPTLQAPTSRLGTRRRAGVLGEEAFVPTPGRSYPPVESLSELQKMRAAYQKVVKDKEMAEAEIRLLKDLKARSQVEVLELRQKLNLSKTPRTNLRATFEDAAKVSLEDDDEESEPLVKDEGVKSEEEEGSWLSGSECEGFEAEVRDAARERARERRKRKRQETAEGKRPATNVSSFDPSIGDLWHDPELPEEEDDGTTTEGSCDRRRRRSESPAPYDLSLIHI
ncbi:hypothetical protein CBR_g1189 [Chara braunii]|uniref:Uncharacterized protein n=1 Tax=Chara braunii TaxID=69332 RepID=A0A388KDC6_CHABU|nr:hypothetical protein CBR_g1189 [Chara braunii]|eukprot:GBG68068.1 hypothetical protein CBR_g1189 [Chara braunii]